MWLHDEDGHHFSCHRVNPLFPWTHVDTIANECILPITAQERMTKPGAFRHILALRSQLEAPLNRILQSINLSNRFYQSFGSTIQRPLAIRGTIREEESAISGYGKRCSTKLDESEEDL